MAYQELKEEGGGGPLCNTRRKGELKQVSPGHSGEKQIGGNVCARSEIHGMVLRGIELKSNPVQSGESYYTGQVAVPRARGGVRYVVGGMSVMRGGINVRASNAVQQLVFLAVPRQRRWVNSDCASDSRDSSSAGPEGGYPVGPGVYRHRQCNYLSRHDAGAFLHSV